MTASGVGVAHSALSGSEFARNASAVVEPIAMNCTDTGFKGVELRSTHRHGVEISLSKQQRADVRSQFQDCDVELMGVSNVTLYTRALLVQPVVQQQCLIDHQTL